MNYFMPFTRCSAPKFKNEAIVKNVNDIRISIFESCNNYSYIECFYYQISHQHINKFITGRFAYVNYKYEIINILAFKQIISKVQNIY